MNKNKVGLCLAGFSGTNYGMLLQAYATQQIVEKLGYDTEIINYRSGKDKHIRPSVGAMVVAGKVIREKIKETLFSKASEQWSKQGNENKEERYEIAEAFRKRYLKNIVECSGYRRLHEASKAYDAVLVGSDQLWQPDVAFTNFYTLRFAAEGVKRISYATSLGVSKYPRYCWKQAGDFWRKIDYLSVREEQGRKIIQSIVNIPVQVVADPTYLFTSKEWEELMPCQEIRKEKYVLCYFLSDNMEAKTIAVQYAHERGAKCIGILSSECDANDDMIYDEVLMGKTPQDFINLIRYASCVFTDSFHGLSFSIIHSKEFYVFYRKRKDTCMSRNSRIDDILKSFDLESRLICDSVNTKISNLPIDYMATQDKVSALREKSLIFLKNALDGKTTP